MISLTYTLYLIRVECKGSYSRESREKRATTLYLIRVECKELFSQNFYIFYYQLYI